jgi:hypothetical protein
MLGIDPAAGVALNWDASGNSPKNPQAGGGLWDTTTNANWSNGSTDTTWANEDYAIFNGSPSVGATVTIDDSSGTVNVVEVIFNGAENYTIAAIPGDSLTLVDAAGIEGTGTISAPITGTRGLRTGSGGTQTLTGHSTYTGITDNNATALVLANGSSLGNTTIWAYDFVAQGTTFAGTNGTGTSGASLTLSGEGNSQSVFSMVDGTVGTFTLKQETGFQYSTFNGVTSGVSNVALTISGGTLAFDLSNTAADELINSGPGTASVSGTNLINISTAGDPYLTLGNYTLISVPAGGLTGTFDFANGLTTESVTVGGSSYTLQLTNTDTAEVLGVLPEPTGVAFVVLGGTVLLGRYRKRFKKKDLTADSTDERG